MTESWDDYLAEGTTDSEQLQNLSYDLGDQAAAASTPAEAVTDLQAAEWSDDTAAYFARDAESWDDYGDRAAGEAASHLEKADLAAASGDDVTAAWEAQQAGFAAETAEDAYGRSDSVGDIATSYSDDADAAVAAAADAGWDPGTDASAYGATTYDTTTYDTTTYDTTTYDTTTYDTTTYDTTTYDTTTYDATSYDSSAGTDVV